MRMTELTIKGCFLAAVFCGSGLVGCDQKKSDFGGTSVTQSTQVQNTTFGDSTCQLSPEEMEPPKMDPIAADCIAKGFYPSHVQVTGDFPRLRCTSVPKASFECTGKGLIEMVGALERLDKDEIVDVLAKGAKTIACGMVETPKKSILTVIWIPPKTCGETGSYVTACYSNQFEREKYKTKIALYRACLDLIQHQ